MIHDILSVVLSCVYNNNYHKGKKNKWLNHCDPVSETRHIRSNIASSSMEISHCPLSQSFLSLVEQDTSGVVQLDFPLALLQEAKAGFPTMDDVMLMWSITMFVHFILSQFKAIALWLADVPSMIRCSVLQWRTREE